MHKHFISYTIEIATTNCMHICISWFGQHEGECNVCYINRNHVYIIHKHKHTTGTVAHTDATSKPKTMQNVTMVRDCIINIRFIFIRLASTWYKQATRAIINSTAENPFAIYMWTFQTIHTCKSMWEMDAIEIYIHKMFKQQVIYINTFCAFIYACVCLSLCVVVCERVFRFDWNGWKVCQVQCLDEIVINVLNLNVFEIGF